MIKKMEKLTFPSSNSRFLLYPLVWNWYWKDASAFSITLIHK